MFVIPFVIHVNDPTGPLILPTVLPVIGRIAEEPNEEVAEASDADADEHVSVLVG